MNFIYGICFQESLAWGVKSFFIRRQILTKYKKRKYMFKLKHFTYIHEGMTNGRPDEEGNNAFSYFAELQQYLTDKKVVVKLINKEV